MPTYDIDFDYTTVHRGGRFSGRSGTLNVDTKIPIDLERDRKELEQLCANFVLQKKPLYKVFMVQIKNVSKTK